MIEHQPPFQHFDLVTAIVCAYVSNNAIPAAEVPLLIASLTQAFKQIASGAHDQPSCEKATPAVPIKKSVTYDFLVCLEDGKKLKSLTRHLRVLGTTPEAYREK